MSIRINAVVCVGFCAISAQFLLKLQAVQILFMEFQRVGEKVTLPRLYKILKKPPASFREFQKFADYNEKNITTLASEIGLIVNTPFRCLFNTTNPDIDLIQAYSLRTIARRQLKD